MDWNTLGGSFGMGGGGLPPPSQGIGYGQRPAMPGPPPGAPGLGGTTRRGSQILDAQGNVIGHYDDNNQPVYHGGGQSLPSPPPGYGPVRTGQGPIAQFPEQGRDIYHGGNMRPPGGYPFPMSIPEPSQPMGVPGSMQQSLYSNGLLRPAMPSMNNQSGY